MRVKLNIGEKETRFIDRINALTGDNVYRCYQCGRCSASCPMAQEMDLLPNQIIRLVQMGMEDRVAGSRTLTVCASCFSCQGRCPKGIDIARVMEAIRYLLDPKGRDFFGPDQLSRALAPELPQQVLVSVYKKFAK